MQDILTNHCESSPHCASLSAFSFHSSPPIADAVDMSVVRTLVLDEVDSLLQLGFETQVSSSAHSSWCVCGNIPHLPYKRASFLQTWKSFSELMSHMDQLDRSCPRSINSSFLWCFRLHLVSCAAIVTVVASYLDRLLPYTCTVNWRFFIIGIFSLTCKTTKISLTKCSHCEWLISCLLACSLILQKLFCHKKVWYRRFTTWKFP